MGRPINKRYFGSGAGNQIKVRAKIGNNPESDGIIISQRSTNRFKVTVGPNTGICRLVNKNSGTLAANEMIVNLLSDEGVLVQATKLYNRTVIVEGNQRVKWNFSTSNTDGAVEATDVEGLITGTIAGTGGGTLTAGTFTGTSTLSNGTVSSFSGTVNINPATFTGPVTGTFVYDGTPYSLSGTQQLNIVGSTWVGYTFTATTDPIPSIGVLTINGTSTSVNQATGESTFTGTSTNAD